MAVSHAKRPWTLEDDTILAQLAAKGATGDQIGRRLRRSEMTTRARAKLLGISVKTQRQLIIEIRTSVRGPV